MQEYIQVVTTTERKEDAERVGTALVEKRLAACAQVIGPIRSTYWWKGNIESAEEWLCTMKTRKGLYDEVERSVKEIHPYETPEIIAMPITAGSDDYLGWLRRELRNG